MIQSGEVAVHGAPSKHRTIEMKKWISPQTTGTEFYDGISWRSSEMELIAAKK